MADATTQARDRIDRALAELERKVQALKARPAVGDDDLFAPRPGDGDQGARVAELEAAGRAAADALAQAADQVRALMAEQEA